MTAHVQRERMERQSFARARLDLLNEVRGCSGLATRLCACWTLLGSLWWHVRMLCVSRATCDVSQVTAEDNKLQRALDASFAHLGARPSYDPEVGAAPPSPIPHRSPDRSRHAAGNGGSRMNTSTASLYAEAAALGRGGVVGSPATP